jgi:poly-gamma-glutamate synthesis protein (capsule biosynthesis protein)
VTLNAVGDLMLARDIITMMDENGSVFPFAAVRPLLADADLTIANMEGTFTERGVAADKFYTFRTPPRHAHGLAEAGIDVVSLGNNHTMDFGAIALEDTLAALEAAGVRYSGAGVNAANARKPVVLETNGLRLAFLSYNAVTESTPAGPSSPGVAWGDEASIRTDVAQAKALADIVIVSLHAGTEYVDAPSAVQRQLGRAAADAGAALVLGHHPHVLQGWERYGSSVIVYSLGNFVFDLDTEDLATLGPRPFQTLVLRFELTEEGVRSVTPRPVYIDPIENRPLPATGDTLRQIEQRIEGLNAGL